MKVLASFFILTALVGCKGQTRAFPVLGPVTVVTIVGRDGSRPISTISDAQSISQIVAFVDSHRTSWGTPWYGIPVPVLTAEFYNGTDFKGSFGVGENFLETQRDGGFFSQSASAKEIQCFFDLAGINRSTLRPLNP